MYTVYIIYDYVYIYTVYAAFPGIPGIPPQAAAITVPPVAGISLASSSQTPVQFMVSCRQGPRSSSRSIDQWPCNRNRLIGGTDSIYKA